MTLYPEDIEAMEKRTTEDQEKMWAIGLTVVTAKAFGYPKFPMVDMVQACRWVLDITGDVGYHTYAGDWARKLTEFGLKCDTINLHRLGLAWPEMAVAITLFREVGVEPLKVIARIDDAHQRG